MSVGTDVNMDAVKSIASYPAERNVFRARFLRELPGVVAGVPQATCNGKCQEIDFMTVNNDTGNIANAH